MFTYCWVKVLKNLEPALLVTKALKFLFADNQNPFYNNTKKYMFSEALGFNNKLIE